jgi:hypothetical protein
MSALATAREEGAAAGVKAAEAEAAAALLGRELSAARANAASLNAELATQGTSSNERLQVAGDWRMWAGRGGGRGNLHEVPIADDVIWQ